MAGAAVLVALLSSCRLWGFGDNGFGQLGTGDRLAVRAPTPAHTNQAFTTVDTAIYHSCGVDLGGALFCWGNNTKGELGLGTSGYATSRNEPTQVGTATDWTAVSTGGESSGQSFTCGIRAGGLYCWGHNGNGQLGLGTSGWAIVDTAPARVGTASDWTAVSAGASGTCGLRGAGTLWCWGDDVSTVPVQVGAAADWDAISVGTHRCGIRAGSQLWCWGSSYSGQVGDGTIGQVAAPTQIRPDLAWTAVATGSDHTCAIAGGGLWCWGLNTVGELGLGATASPEDDPTPTPQRVGDATDWTAISAGSAKTCGIRTGGRLFCWGNWYPGDGSASTSQNVPTEAQGTWLTVAVGTLHVIGTH